MKGKAASKRKLKLNTPAEDRAIRSAVKSDRDTRELTEKDFAQIRQFTDVVRARGRPKSTVRKEPVTVRLDPEIVLSRERERLADAYERGVGGIRQQEPPGKNSRAELIGVDLGTVCEQQTRCRKHVHSHIADQAAGNCGCIRIEAMPASVLIADDNPINLKLATDVLEAAGLEVNWAANAEEALRSIKALTPRLILMDIGLPGTDGLTFTRILRKDPHYCGIRIGALPAFAMKGDDKKAMEAGCDGYICKPINTRTFAEQVRVYLSEASGSGPSSPESSL